MPDASAPRHASTELLSAHLDGRSAADEDTFLATHLPACARCADELAGLTAVRALLQRMPVAVPPRSFVLPVPVALDEPARILQFPRLATLTRATSAVAAVFFVLFLTADMAGLGERQLLPVSGALPPTAITASVPAPSSAGAPSTGGAPERLPAAAPALLPAASPAAPRSAAEAKPAVAAKPAAEATPAAAVRPAAEAKPAAAAKSAAESKPAAAAKPAAPPADAKPTESAARADQPPALVAATMAPTVAPAPTTGFSVPATVGLPTPALRPPPRATGETSVADSRASGDAAREAEAQDQPGGAAVGRARLGAMANSVNQLAGSPSPLRWSWIGTGLLALLLLLGSLVVGRWRGR